jgi:hypothetical protein
MRDMEQVKKASEELQRVEKAIEAAREKIGAFQSRITELNARREDLIIQNALTGNYDKEIASIDKEISNIQKDTSDQEKIRTALQGRHGEFERAFKIQDIIETDVTAYQTAHAEFLKLAPAVVSLTSLKEAIKTIEGKITRLEDIQEKRLYLMRKLFDFMNEQELESLGTLTRESLQADKEAASKHYQILLSNADALIDFSDELNNLQYRLFSLSTLMPGNYVLKSPPVPIPEPEYSADSRFMRKYVSPNWELWELDSSAYNPENRKWFCVQICLQKPEFPASSLLKMPSPLPGIGSITIEPIPIEEGI